MEAEAMPVTRKEERRLERKQIRTSLSFIPKAIVVVISAIIGGIFMLAVLFPALAFVMFGMLAPGIIGAKQARFIEKYKAYVGARFMRAFMHRAMGGTP